MASRPAESGDKTKDVRRLSATTALPTTATATTTTTAKARTNQSGSGHFRFDQLKRGAPEPAADGHRQPARLECTWFLIFADGAPEGQTRRADAPKRSSEASRAAAAGWTGRTVVSGGVCELKAAHVNGCIKAPLNRH
jgi:hypothetical protein